MTRHGAGASLTDRLRELGLDATGLAGATVSALTGGTARVELAAALQELHHTGWCVGLTPEQTDEVIHHWTDHLSHRGSTRSLLDPEIQSWIQDKLIGRALGKQWRRAEP